MTGNADSARCASLAASLALLLLAACAGPSSDPAHVVRGPLPTRVLQPVGLLFPGPEPRRAHVLPEGRTFLRPEVGYASIFEQNVGPSETASFDGEIARFALELRRGLGRGLELAIEPNVLFATSGFLDRIVDEFHAATGFVGGGREDRERDQFDMRLVKDGVTAYALEEDQVLFGDLPVTLTAALREEDSHGPAVAARFTVELPTGDDDRGAGSGGIDVAAGVLVERSVGRWTFFGGIDGVLPEDPDGFEAAGVEARALGFASGGVEYRWNDRVSLLGQAVLQTPFTRSLGAEEIDREILDLGFGLAWDLAPGATGFASFHEDAVAASGPDATVQVGVAFTW